MRSNARQLVVQNQTLRREVLEQSRLVEQERQQLQQEWVFYQ